MRSWLVVAAIGAALLVAPVANAAEPQTARASATPAGQDGEADDSDLPVEAAITNPDWVQLPTGEEMSRYYPPLAAALGLDGNAQMTCKVNSLGMVQDCRINSETPAGLGFAAAAIQMAPYFRMRPEMINGTPESGASVTIPIHFAMAPDSTAAPDVADTAGAPPSEAMMSLALEVADLMQSPTITKERGDRAQAQLELVANRQGAAGGLDRDQVNKAITAWRAAYDAAMPRWREMTARAYVRHFSEGELRQALVFFRSPAGRAWLTRSPVVDQELSGSAQAWSRVISDDARVRFCKETACSPPAPAPAKTNAKP